MMAEPCEEFSELLLKGSVSEKPAVSVRSFEEQVVLKAAVFELFFFFFFKAVAFTDTDAGD